MEIGFSKKALSVLRPADVIYTHGESFIAKAIRWFTAPAWASHAGIMLAPPAISEALAQGIKTRNIGEYEGAFAIAVRIPGLTEAMRTAAVNAAISEEGKAYPYLKVGLLHAIDHKIVRGRYVFRRLAFSDNNYCNAHVAYALRRTRHPEALFPEDLDEGTPDSMLDEQLRFRKHPVVWASSQECLDSLRKAYNGISI